jgi:hypothetical protein
MLTWPENLWPTTAAVADPDCCCGRCSGYLISDAVQCPARCPPTPAFWNAFGAPARPFPRGATFSDWEGNRPSGKGPRRPTPLSRHAVTEVLAEDCHPMHCSQIYGWLEVTLRTMQRVARPVGGDTRVVWWVPFVGSPKDRSGRIAQTGVPSLTLSCEVLSSSRSCWTKSKGAPTASALVTESGS